MAEVESAAPRFVDAQAVSLDGWKRVR